VSVDPKRLTEGILFTDQYQLTMAQLYWRMGLAELEAQFDFFFRRYPDYGEHQAGYCVFAGLGELLGWMENLSFTSEDIDLLRSQRTATEAPRFEEAFLDWLGSHGSFVGMAVDAVPEGRIIHANAPAVMVRGPLAMAQILETSLLNHLNYNTLIATKAARVSEATRGGAVLEFGMRRGPGLGANAGGHAALVGGADYSSNVGLSHLLGLDPKGTHAHSMVQVFIALGMSELDAFRAYAETYPDDCILLVDTIDTLNSGLPNAIAIFEELRAGGHEPRGIRLDSGDLAYLAIRAAGMLDAAGFSSTSIVLSSELDELAIWQINTQIETEAPRYGVDGTALLDRLIYGVGTRLITSDGHSALGGVYKLVAVNDGSEWQAAIKISDSPEKMPVPGTKRLWRVYDQRGLATADVMSLDDDDLVGATELTLHDPHRAGVARTLTGTDIGSVEELTERVFAEGRPAGAPSGLDDLRSRRVADLERLDPGVRRLINPHVYHVSVTTRLYELQRSLIAGS
jgi:nicotinate phosphoribosyltransferase